MGHKNDENKNSVLHIGLDVGSTTVKIAVIDDDENLLNRRFGIYFSRVLRFAGNDFAERTAGKRGLRFCYHVYALA